MIDAFLIFIAIIGSIPTFALVLWLAHTYIELTYNKPEPKKLIKQTDYMNDFGFEEISLPPRKNK
jgi:Na+-driven multidrug efflux pump